MGDELIDFFKGYSKRLRMEYGQAMNLEGFAPDIIVSVQERVARSMIDWLQTEA